jgi:hypothetical protein
VRPADDIPEELSRGICVVGIDQGVHGADHT